MMNNDTEKIIRELYEIDPSLKDVGDIRGIVAALLESRPQVKLDENFVQKLRAQIMSQVAVSGRKVGHNFNWWMVHLAPIGAIAVLFLLIGPFGNPEVIPGQAPDLYRTMESAPASGAPAPSLMTNRASPGIDVVTQKPGNVVIITSVTWGSPSYVAIHADRDGEPGEIIGKSDPLPTGRIETVRIELSRRMEDGKTYHAVLYPEAGAKPVGNGGTAANDAGKPYSVPFTVSEDAAFPDR